MCTQEPTSSEHVPPKCLFPEAKDVGKDYRKNLITVPSCPLHNSSKSKDDEFLMISLAGILGNNSIGYAHKLTKVDRALRRSAHRLIDKIIVKRKASFITRLGENKFIESIWGTPDIKRLHTCFDHIARGLHFHHFGYRFSGQTKPLLGYLHYEHEQSQTWIEFIRHRAEIDLRDKPQLGENPDVFTYQISDFDEYGLFMMKLCFYGGISVYVAFMHESATPSTNLAHQLLAAGFPSVLTLEDKEYRFNFSDQQEK